MDLDAEDSVLAKKIQQVQDTRFPESDWDKIDDIDIAHMENSGEFWRDLFILIAEVLSET